MKKILSLLCAATIATSLAAPALAAPTATKSTTAPTAKPTATVTVKPTPTPTAKPTATATKQSFKEALSTNRAASKKNREDCAAQRLDNVKFRAAYLTALKDYKKANKTVPADARKSQRVAVAKILKLKVSIAADEKNITAKLRAATPIVKAGKNVSKLNTAYGAILKLQEKLLSSLKAVGVQYTELEKLFK